ncbi:carboxyvinyl-carboxyphosphonate phosphorylmutase, partial [Myxococcota bacterium]|nr:carboxyvinyl-carboxyphosphonate phosphorylmutase [Myxococcota bacterium]
APQSESEMQRFCAEAPGAKMANLVEGGDTPLLAPTRLEELGFSIAAYPLTLLSSAIRGMQGALEALRDGHAPDGPLPFEALRETVGFPEYDSELDRYRSNQD